jgi:hypothetical protein
MYVTSGKLKNVESLREKDYQCYHWQKKEKSYRKGKEESVLRREFVEQTL